MVLKWRRAFCKSISKEDDTRGSPIIKEKLEPDPSPRLGSRFGGIFSNPSTPRMKSKPAVNVSVPSSSAPQSPKLRCRTRESSDLFTQSQSTPSSPRSPSAFNLLKLSINRAPKSRCGICLQKMNSEQGTAMFTAECGHTFHFPCMSAAVNKHGALTCLICNSTWKEPPLLPSDEPYQGRIRTRNRSEAVARDSNPKNSSRCLLKVYNDDEPLSFPAFGVRFNPIIESDEIDEEETDDFPNFLAESSRSFEISLSPEAASISVTKSSETCAVVLKIRAPAVPARRAPIDLVMVLNVGRSITFEKLHLLKKSMRLMLSSLSESDRLSIVAFSAAASKRLLPLRRMNTAGKRSARRIIDAVVALDTAATCATDALKKAAKVISDRREKNPTAGIVLLSDGHRNAAVVSSTTFTGIPLHSVNLTAAVDAADGNTFAKCISGLLSVAVQDLNVKLEFRASSAPAGVAAVYSHEIKPALLAGGGSGWFRTGGFRSGEEREFLIELKSGPSRRREQRRVLFIQCSYKDPLTLQSVRHDDQVALPVPPPRAGGSSTHLKCLFITTRAVAESKRLVQRNDVVGAKRMLVSGRALVLKSGSSSDPDSVVQFVRRLDAELAELSWTEQGQLVGRSNSGSEAGSVEDKPEPLTPTSAWRAAERLAKVAIMRKSLNRVSDLHGFEDARF
ncbi:probable E3 ubiquitin-protein ligase EDA40 [Andrographis paniculata]|uniref:probable E3 ubiquitin-protein ligase EDA40 n=1 Tax=Andrographis paniculata TaxID=175694 RepID=UPI0021E8803F|nr:probable E3 ubiquitin-protein ligase EDA40 [Andrographis paniculata]